MTVTYTRVGTNQLIAVSDTNCQLDPASPRNIPPGFSIHSQITTITVTVADTNAPVTGPFYQRADVPLALGLRALVIARSKFVTRPKGRNESVAVTLPQTA